MFMSREAAVLKCIEENPNMDYSVHGGKTLQTSLMGEIGFHLNIRLTSLTRAKCGTRSTLCWTIRNISGSIELFAL